MKPVFILDRREFVEIVGQLSMAMHTLERFQKTMQEKKLKIS